MGNDLEVLRKRLEVARKSLEALSLQEAGSVRSEVSTKLLMDKQVKEEEIHDLENKIKQLGNLNSQLNSEMVIPFINREQELKNIMASAEAGTISAKYFIVDAPAGYGKSVFLEELSRRFKNKKNGSDRNAWDCALVRVSPNMEPFQLYEDLARSLGIEVKSLTSDSPGYQVSSSWIQKFNHTEFEGLVLLFDFDNEPNEKLINTLVNEFIPKFQKNLSTNLVQYERGNLVFRVVIAGRDLNKDNVVGSIYSPYTPIYLSAFNHQNINETIFAFWPNLPDQSRSEIAAHILFFTGGHPGAMGEILIRLKSQVVPIDEIGKVFEEIYWDAVVKKYANEVETVYHHYALQNEHLSPVMENIPFFRYLNDKLLRVFISEHNMEEELENEDTLDPILVGDLIQGIKLYSKDDANFFVDAITRRLMIIWLRQNRKNQFKKYAQKAQHICEKLMREDLRHPTRWFLEYIFQEIQGSAFENNREERMKLQDKIFSETLPYITGIFLKRELDWQDKRDECNDLLAEIHTEQHWEFRFLFNFQLRGEFYNDEPIKNLMEYLKTSFKS